jgi:thiamine pyrophosphate-dependent acetolactate synthase large subunit-like protein
MVPVLARGRYPLTELDQQALFRPLTKWNGVIDRADRLPETVRAAFRAMTSGKPGAAHLALPFDTQKDASVHSPPALVRGTRSVLGRLMVHLLAVVRQSDRRDGWRAVPISAR